MFLFVGLDVSSVLPEEMTIKYLRITVYNMMYENMFSLKE